MRSHNQTKRIETVSEPENDVPGFGKVDLN